MWCLIDDLALWQLLIKRYLFLTAVTYRTPPLGKASCLSILGCQRVLFDIMTMAAVFAWSRWVAQATCKSKPQLVVPTDPCIWKTLEEIGYVGKDSTPFMALNNNGCICQNSEWAMANSLELSAPNCCFALRVGSENGDGGGGKEKHAGSFSPLSCHLGFVEGFSPSHFPSIEK